MNKPNETKKYEAYKIPTREQPPDNEAVKTLRQHKAASSAPFNIQNETQKFAEIELAGSENIKLIEEYSIPQKPAAHDAESQPFQMPFEPITDEKRKTFFAMRQISREEQFLRIVHTKILYKHEQRVELSKLFYKQAEFMKDFEDDFNEQALFSTYYPYYQLMNYEQFRTYFTWRTHVRKGDIRNTSLSYAYLYIYELLNNIGVTDPQDGLDSLMAFREAYISFDASIDRYLLKWIKDYHIYYDLTKPFGNFIYDSNIYLHYQDTQTYNPENEDSFELFCGISKYDIKQSAFYSDENRELITDCFCFVIDRLTQVLKNAGIDLDNLIFRPVKNKPVWNPFNGALFYPQLNQPDKKVMLSDNEIYICRNNKWSCITAGDSNKQLAGYIMKQTESALRKVMRYKYKLSANTSMIDGETEKMLAASGIILENEINNAVVEFYAEINKTIVSVDVSALEKIRQEALDIQEKLIIQDIADTSSVPPVPEPEIHKNDEASQAPQASAETTPQIPDGWTSLKQALTNTELDALSIILNEENIKEFSDANGIMLEVLIDGINEKAYDTINDTILDIGETVTAYEEYYNELMKVVGS